MDFLAKEFSDLGARFANNVGFTIGVVISVLAFTALYYYIVKFLINNNSKHMLYMSLIALVIAGLVVIFNEKIQNAIFIFVPFALVILIVCIYSVELKRVLWAKKNKKMAEARKEGIVVDEEKVQTCISEIIKALQDMSKNDVGAIIVLSNSNVSSQIIDSGVRVESDISSALIESIFFPKTPLHDGAMIIDGTKIVSAGCFLPLSQQVDKLPKDLGTRHRAGLGVTENYDVISIIVSEETGIISVAKAGNFTRYADYESLKKVLNDYYWKDLEILKK